MEPHAEGSMEGSLFIILENLRRCRNRLTATVQLARENSAAACARTETVNSCPEAEAQVRQQLDRARRAAGAIRSSSAPPAVAAAAAAASVGSASPPADATTAPTDRCSFDFYEQDAAEAMVALTSVSIALAAEEPTVSPQLRAFAAAEAHAVVTEIATSLAQVQQRLVFQAARAARASAATGDAAAAARGAAAALDALAVAMWIARAGGVLGTLGMTTALEAATEAQRAAAALQRQGEPATEAAECKAASPHTGPGCASAQGDQTAADHGTSAAGGAAPSAAVSSTASRVAPLHASLSLQAADDGDGVGGGGDGDDRPLASREGQPTGPSGAAAEAGTAAADVGAGAATAAADRLGAVAEELGAVADAVAQTVEAAARQRSASTSRRRNDAVSGDGTSNCVEGPAGAVSGGPSGALSPRSAASNGGAEPLVGDVCSGSVPGDKSGDGAAEAGVVAAADNGTATRQGTLAGVRGRSGSPTVAGVPASNAPVAPDHESSSSSGGRGGSEAGPIGPTAPRTLPREPPAGPSELKTWCYGLSYLASLSHDASADGELPAEALDAAVAACCSTLGCGLEVPEELSWRWHSGTVVGACAAAWAHPRTRCGLMKLLSYTVRQVLRIGTSGWAAAGDRLPPCAQILRLLMHSLLLGVLDGGGLRPAEGEAEVVEVLVRTDLVQCLTRLMAAAGADVEDVATLATMADRIGMPKAWMPAAESGLHLMWYCLERIAPLTLQSLSLPANAPEGLRAALQQLRGALLKSRTLEHAARAVVRWVRLTSEARATEEVKRRAACNADQVIFVLFRVLELTSSPDRPLAVWATAALSGPCVQFLLLLHAVSQLCAADDGPEYGLPSGVRLPPAEAQAAGGDNGFAGPSNSGPPPLRLRADVVARALRWWWHNERFRPCSAKALRALCKRAAAAAGASLGADSAAAASADAEGMGYREGLFSPPQDALSLAVVAHQLLLGQARGGGAVGSGELRRLWASAVQTANAAVWIEPDRTLIGSLTCAVFLTTIFPRPPLGAALPSDATSLPSQPGPDLAAALTSGYVPALERAIRHEARAAGTPADQLKSPLTAINSLLVDCRRLAYLMAYGEPTSVAALLATAAKVAAVAYSAGCSGVDSGDFGCTLLLRLLESTVEGLARASKTLFGWDGRGSGPADTLWWQRHCGAGSGGDSGGPPDAAGGSMPGGSCSLARPDRGSDAVGGSSSGGGAGGRDSSGGSVAAGGSGGGLGAGERCGAISVGSSVGGGGRLGRDLPPLHQTLLLATFTATRWLPLLARMGCPTAPEGSKQFFRCALPVLLDLSVLLMHAYLRCREAGGGGGGGGATTASSASGCLAGAAASGSAAASGAAAAVAVASWERLLLGELDQPGLMLAVAQGVAADTADLDVRHLGFALLHVLVAFPRQGRQVLRSKVRVKKADGRGRVKERAVPLGSWLCEVLAEDVDGVYYEDARDHFLELAPAVAGGAEPSQRDVDRLFEAAGEPTAWLGLLLPPPCLAESLLQGLPVCANPTCTNLEGDSEAALGLPVWAGSGGLPYCSPECQRAHGHGAGGGV